MSARGSPGTRSSGWPDEALEARPQLVSVARRVVRDRAEAEDVADEAIARLVEAREAGTEIASGIAWLTRTTLRIAVDRARAWVRRQRDAWRLDVAAHDRARRGGAFADTGDPYGGGGTDPSAVLASVEARERIWRAILDLPPRQRDALVLRQLEGLPAAEVAARLGVEEPTVRAHIHAAREALRARLFDRDARTGRDDRGDQADLGNGGER